MNVAGHRISTMEVESALVDHPNVAESAVIGKQHEIKGQAICAFVSLKASVSSSDGLVDVLKGHVARKIGPIARPDDILFVAELPKGYFVIPQAAREVAAVLKGGVPASAVNPEALKGRAR